MTYFRSEENFDCFILDYYFRIALWTNFKPNLFIQAFKKFPPTFQNQILSKILSSLCWSKKLQIFISRGLKEQIRKHLINIKECHIQNLRCFWRLKRTWYINRHNYIGVHIQIYQFPQILQCSIEHHINLQHVNTRNHSLIL